MCMLNEERIKLQKASVENAYLSIAITVDGTPMHGGFIPWKHTSNAFNMKTPNVTISIDDLQDKEIMGEIYKCKINGCYILTSLSDYSFLSQFHDLWDLFIRCGENINDLSFIRNMPGLFLFYLEDAKLKDIRPLIENCNHGDSLPAKCFGFCHCEVEDTSAMKEARFIISELLIWPVDSKNENRERWDTGRYIDEFNIYNGR